MFLENLLLNKNHLLQNRTLHISNAFKNDLKANIDREKANIEDLKSNIESVFTAKTAAHIFKLRESFDDNTVFGRSEVQKILGLKPTRTSALLSQLADHQIIEAVTGFGKGKYRFRRSRTEPDD